MGWPLSGKSDRILWQKSGIPNWWKTAELRFEFRGEAGTWPVSSIQCFIVPVKELAYRRRYGRYMRMQSTKFCSRNKGIQSHIVIQDTSTARRAKKTLVNEFEGWGTLAWESLWPIISVVYRDLNVCNHHPMAIAIWIRSSALVFSSSAVSDKPFKSQYGLKQEVSTDIVLRYTHYHTNNRVWDHKNSSLQSTPLPTIGQIQTWKVWPVQIQYPFENIWGNSQFLSPPFFNWT
jgi:hypothetical protein